MIDDESSKLEKKAAILNPFEAKSLGSPTSEGKAVLNPFMCDPRNPFLKKTSAT